MNKFIGIGNLTNDPEMRTTNDGTSVCTFKIAIERFFNKKKEVDYLPIVTWRALAENCAKFLSKGKKVGVSGRIQVRSYDAQNGERKYVTEVVADDVEFLSPKEHEAGHKDNDPPNTGFFDDGEVEELDDENMPF